MFGFFSNTDHKGNISETKSPKAGAHQVYASLSPTDMSGAPDAAVSQGGGGSESCHRVRPRSRKKSFQAIRQRFCLRGWASAHA